MRLRIASRKSDLAKLQSYRVGKALKTAHPDLEIEYIFRSSLGDINQTDPLWKMPEKGVFTEDFLEGLKTGEFDLVVHSWKDLPTETRVETELIATLDRADQRDLILFPKSSLQNKELKHWRILSSSPRREYNLTPFLKSHLPQSSHSFEFLPVRGNIQTRLKKLMEGQGEALVVAKAAIDRLIEAEEPEFKETQDLIKSILKQCQWMVAPLSLNPTAAAQGAIVVEAKSDREDVRELFSSINNTKDFQSVTEERRQLSAYGGGCHLKIGISIAQQGESRFLFTRGLTPEGTDFAVEKTLTTKSQNTFSPNELWPIPLNDFAAFDRVARAPQLDQLEGIDAVVVSRVGPGFEAYLPALKDKWIWAAGTKTWSKLAQMGLWVHGCFDSLGAHTPKVDSLVGRPLKWAKLTHDQASPQSTMKTLAYYGLTPKKQMNWAKEFDGKRSFFWMSFTQFSEALKHCPEIRAAQHACGPGQTADRLKAALGHDSVDIYLSLEEWFNCSQPSI